MALSDEQIAEITFSVYGSAMHPSDYEYARAIEGEVRKQDDALILQLVEALENYHSGRSQAATAGRARLEGKP